MSNASRQMSWLLRHNAKRMGLSIDKEGFAPIEQVLKVLNITRAELDDAVLNNNKKRFDVVGDRVRAVQGHSTGQVSIEAMEASWEQVKDLDVIWHGTSLSAIEGIVKHGLLPMNRTHVHLAPTPNATVGKRHNVDILLGVSVSRLAALGIPVFKSPNGVLLTRSVPVSAIMDVVGAATYDITTLTKIKKSFGIQ